MGRRFVFSSSPEAACHRAAVGLSAAFAAASAFLNASSLYYPVYHIFAANGEETLNRKRSIFNQSAKKKRQRI